MIAKEKSLQFSNEVQGFSRMNLSLGVGATVGVV